MAERPTVARETGVRFSPSALFEMKISLRKAKKEDFKEIAKLYSKEYSKSPFNEPWTLKKALYKLGLFSNYCDIWKIEYNKKMAGFIIINSKCWCPGEIIFGEEMAIKDEYRRKDIAATTLNRIFGIYKKRGFKTYIGIVNKKSKSLGLHQKVGTYKSKDNIIMEKKL